MERSISKFVLFLGLNFFFCPAVSIYKQIRIHQLKNSNLSQIFAYFELDLQKFEQVEADIRFFDWSELKLKKENRTRKLFGQMKYFVPADNSFQVEMTSFTKQGGEYRKLPFRVARKNLCDFYQNSKNFYHELAAVSDLPMPFVCPLANVSKESNFISFHCELTFISFQQPGNLYGQRIHSDVQTHSINYFT